jgi:hypothetical protein
MSTEHFQAGSNCSSWVKWFLYQSFMRLTLLVGERIVLPHAFSLASASFVLQPTLL